MHILIIEDEPLASENLEKMLLDVAPDIQKISRTESVAQTIGYLADSLKKPDLIFMDIHLSDGSAFSIFSNTTLETPVIFTTAYDKYALQAFKVNSIDYLLKPIDTEQLEAAVDKFRKYSRHDIGKYLSQLTKMELFNRHPEKILVPLDDELLPIAVDEIACFYATNGYTKVFKCDGKSYPHQKRLDNIMLSLNPLYFFRANKQFIVSKRYVAGITIWFDNRLRVSLPPQVDMPEEIYVSKNRASEFRRWIAS